MHVVDATLFYSPTSGGVKRYLLAKHEWMRAHTNWRHSLVVPGEHSTHAPGDISTVAGSLVPGAFNYRLPLNPVRWSRAIDALEPDLIEVGDAFHPAWAAANVASRRGIPLIAFYHSNFPAARGPAARARACRNSSSGTCGSPTSAASRCSRRAATCATTCTASASRTPPASRSASTSTPSIPSGATRDLRAELESAARHAAAGVRRAFLRGEEHSGADRGVPPSRRPVSPVADRRRRRGRDGNVTRLPYCRDNRELASYFASADAFVHAGTHETFGLVMLEAMACGRPVVAMRAGAIPELVDETRRRAGGTARGRGTPPRDISPARLPRCTSATSTRSARRRAATWWQTTAGRVRCRRSWRVTRRRWRRASSCRACDGACARRDPTQ